MSMVRKSLLFLVSLSVGLSQLFGASVPNHPLYFEQRSSGLFETQTAGQSLIIRADRIQLDDVTLRFVHASKIKNLGLGRLIPRSAGR